jgi:hypothetical protein
VAELTLLSLSRHVPPAVPGNQSETDLYFKKHSLLQEAANYKINKLIKKIICTFWKFAIKAL